MFLDTICPDYPSLRPHHQNFLSGLLHRSTINIYETAKSLHPLIRNWRVIWCRTRNTISALSVNLFESRHFPSQGVTHYYFCFRTTQNVKELVVLWFSNDSSQKTTSRSTPSKIFGLCRTFQSFQSLHRLYDNGRLNLQCRRGLLSYHAILVYSLEVKF